MVAAAAGSSVTHAFMKCCVDRHIVVACIAACQACVDAIGTDLKGPLSWPRPRGTRLQGSFLSMRGNFRPLIGH
jgi:hypothetical protein